MYGGRALSGGAYDDGYYIEPTIFTDVGPEMRIAQEEIFGPVLTVFKAKDLDDAVATSNNVEFGLSSSIYTKDLTEAFRYVDTVEAGVGETVLVVSGSSARMASGLKDRPIDAAIVGIVDEIEIKD